MLGVFSASRLFSFNSDLGEVTDLAFSFDLVESSSWSFFLTASDPVKETVGVFLLERKEVGFLDVEGF